MRGKCASQPFIFELREDVSKPGPGIALLLVGRGAARVARELASIELGRDDDPPLPSSQQEVPGSHQVGVSVELTPGVLR